MKTSSIGKLVLATSLAFGGSLVQSQLNGHEAEASTINGVFESNGYYSSNAANTLTTKLSFFAETSDGFPTVNPRFEIKDTSGSVVKSGSLNFYNKTTEQGAYKFTSLTNINVSSLAPGKYRINLSIPMSDGVVTSSYEASLTQHFEILSNRTVTNFAR